MKRGYFNNLRFAVGTEVLCLSGEPQSWCRGKVVSQNYREKKWPKDQVAAYQVELSGGRLVFVPHDIPELCKELQKEWEQAVAVADLQKLKVATAWTCEDSDHTGRTPLLACVMNGWQQGAVLLLDQHADLSRTAGSDKSTALHLAAMPLTRVTFQESAVDSFTFSLEDGIVSSRLQKINYPGDDEIHEQLLSLSYDERAGKLTWTASLGSSWAELPTHLQSWVPGRLATLLQGTTVQTQGLPKPASRLPLVKALLEARADVNAQNEDPENDMDNFTSTTYSGLEQRQHRSALHYAAEEGEAGICGTLIAARAIIDLEDRFKMTPLDLAVEEGKKLVIDVLLRKAADPNRGNFQRGLQQTCLHQVCDQGKTELAEVLLKGGSKINAVGKQDMTALHLAARKGHLGVLKVLLEADADVHSKDKSGRTPGQYATSKMSEVGKALALDDSLQLSDRIALLQSAEQSQQRKDEDKQSMFATCEFVS
mmetsp:Transcript_97681/g.174015  ORF Transcript_97681/g.174015 Transcript_97681/m.174015 type:complete len:482 (+) Transcript_97681:133-1578(+)